MKSPQQLASIGVNHLEKAVLYVLLEAMETQPEAPFVRAVDISRKIGVSGWDLDSWLVAPILIKLKTDGRVEQKAKYGPWKLTETAYQLIGTIGKTAAFQISNYTDEHRKPNPL